jgi:hypothetical protein
LPNQDLTYIRNPEREIKLCYVLSPLKNFNQEPFCILYFFFHPPTGRKADAKLSPRAHIYALEARFCQVAKDGNLICQTVGGVLSAFL